MNNDCTVCMLEGAGKFPTRQPDYPEPSCEGVEGFRGGRGGGRGGRRGGYRRGYRNWRGGYSGFGYYPYWYGSHYYSPSYYDYPYVSNQPVLSGVVRPSSGYGGNNTMTFTIALIALIVAFFALKK